MKEEPKWKIELVTQNAKNLGEMNCGMVGLFPPISILWCNDQRNLRKFSSFIHKATGDGNPRTSSKERSILTLQWLVWNLLYSATSWMVVSTSTGGSLPSCVEMQKPASMCVFSCTTPCCKGHWNCHMFCNCTDQRGLRLRARVL